MHDTWGDGWNGNLLWVGDQYVEFERHKGDADGYSGEWGLL